MIKAITLFLIGAIAGAGAMYIFLIGELRAKQTKMEVFSECLETKINSHAGLELWIVDVLDCYETIIKQ